MEKTPRGENDPSTIAWAALFIVTGMTTPMLVTQVRYEHTFPALTLWYLYPVYLGNLIAGVKSAPVRRPEWMLASRVFLFDIAGQTFGNIGLLIIGPPLFSTFYSSVTAWTAVMAVLFGRPTSRPTSRQWGAIALITLGLSFEGRDALQTLGQYELLGALSVMVGCVFFAAGAVVSELYITSSSSGSSPLQPLQAAWVVGVNGCIFCVFWAAYWLREIPSSPVAWACIGGMCCTNALHQAAWYTLVGRLGACATSVIKAIQSVSIFFVAGQIFCQRDPAECLTPAKVGSFLIVTMAVVIYAWPTSAAEQVVDLLAAKENADNETDLATTSSQSWHQASKRAVRSSGYGST